VEADASADFGHADAGAIPRDQLQDIQASLQRLDHSGLRPGGFPSSDFDVFHHTP
jgi:hypothetical protein